MNACYEYFFMACKKLKRNWVRSTLTALGILIGTASIIAILSIGQGGRLRMNSELSDLGIERVWVYAIASEDKKTTELTLDDIEFIKRKGKQSSLVCANLYTRLDVMCNGQRVSVDVVGTQYTLPLMEEVALISGRFISKYDEINNRNVIVLGKEVAHKLFGEKNPMMNKVYIMGESFTVIGIQQMPAFSIIGGIGREKAYVPIKVLQSIYHIKRVDEISLKVLDNQPIEAVGDSVVSALEQRNNNPNAYASYNLSHEKKTADEVIDIFTFVLISVGSISLMVGGIGVMNIMLVIVRESTQEIGIRKALGASDKQIMGQFLMEAAVISIFGSILGVFIGILLTYIGSTVIPVPYTISPWSVLVAVFFSSAVGILFGIYPARRAAFMNTVDALRQE